MNVGHSADLDITLIEQGVLKHFSDISKARGIQVPTDPVDFLNRARVIFFDENGNPLEVASCNLLWEE